MSQQAQFQITIIIDEYSGSITHYVYHLVVGFAAVGESFARERIINCGLRLCLCVPLKTQDLDADLSAQTGNGRAGNLRLEHSADIEGLMGGRNGFKYFQGKKYK